MKRRSFSYWGKRTRHKHESFQNQKKMKEMAYYECVFYWVKILKLIRFTRIFNKGSVRCIYKLPVCNICTISPCSWHTITLMCQLIFHIQLRLYDINNKPGRLCFIFNWDCIISRINQGGCVSYSTETV